MMRTVAFYFALLFVAAPVCADAADNGLPQSYISCRCCCPVNRENLAVTCLFHGQGKTMEDVIRWDDEWRKNGEQCPADAGCTRPILYKYCD